MKRFPILAAPLLFCLLASCPKVDPQAPKDPYETARFSVTVMRATIQNAKFGFDSVVTIVRQTCTVQVCAKQFPDTSSQQYKDCMLADHSQEADYKKCDQISPVVPYVEVAVKIALQGCDTATEAIQLAASLKRVREDKKLRSACDGGDQDACAEYQKRVEAICLQVDPTKGTEYQDCVAGKPVAKADWSGVLKRSACLAYEAFALVPANPKYDLYINAVRLWLKGYGGCK